ncbi:hypothetical protein DNTS_017939, partial [Danionella cerebrum]
LLSFVSLEENNNCFSEEFSFEQLDKQLGDIKNCLETSSDKWTSHQMANIFNQLQTLAAIIQKKDNKALQNLLAKNCSAPTVPENGGLLCASVKNRTFCKPMCNEGYDFNFIRRSRLFEECSASTKHKWTTQFIGGNKLAICIKSHLSVSGAPTAYFDGLDCHKTKSDVQLVENITSVFQSELAMVGITEIESLRLFCG